MGDERLKYREASRSAAALGDAIVTVMNRMRAEVDAGELLAILGQVAGTVLHICDGEESRALGRDVFITNMDIRCAELDAEHVKQKQ